MCTKYSSAISFNKSVSQRLRNWGLCIVFLLTSLCQLIAQQSADVQFNLVLTDVQSITLNQNQKNVTIVLNDAADFASGKTLVQPDHIKISSTSDYEIKVMASTDLKGISANIPVGTIGVFPSLGSRGGPSSTPLFFSDIYLSTDQQTLVQSDDGDVLRSFDIDYNVSGEQLYNKPAGTYTTTIIYSILPN